jgi:hypothetical protein
VGELNDYRICLETAKILPRLICILCGRDSPQQGTLPDLSAVLQEIAGIIGGNEYSDA